MREIVVGTFLSLDGVMQAPGGPEEDPTGGFRFGGWTAPFWDETIGAAMDESFAAPYDLLLGRRTYDIFSAHWPHIETDPSAPGYDPGMGVLADTFNRCTKYVATHNPGTLDWINSEALGTDVVERLRTLKAGDGLRLVVQGSSVLIATLLANDLVDELRLLTFPVILGKGKRLFTDTSMPSALKLTKSVTSPNGVIITTYRRDGEIKTGSFALEEPTEAELARRKSMS